jgi:hypothetical protein
MANLSLNTDLLTPKRYPQNYLLRIVGTHNSYHHQQYEGSETYWANGWARFIREWAYDHPPLTDQLNMGWRNIELDFHLRKKSSMIYHVQMWDQLTNECTCAASCFRRGVNSLNTMLRFFLLFKILKS